MPRRVRLPRLVPGPNILPPDQAHHLRDVLRMRTGDTVELFTDEGALAEAVLHEVTPDRVVALVTTLSAPPMEPSPLVIASAIPRSHRADWMIEKLSELGVARFIPLSAQRSVVLPEGKNKLERWRRLATESAKQSRRVGTMAIDPLTPIPSAIRIALDLGDGIYLSPTDAVPIHRFLDAQRPPRPLCCLVGPEGGWSPDEIESFTAAGLTGVGLTTTILRIETAAIAAAAVVACWRAR